MDAKERHELKDNDLAEFLEHFGEFWGKHGNSIMVVVTIVLVVFIGKRYYSNSQAVSHENAWADLSSTETPQGYRERAIESADIAGVPQLALLRGAEAFHQQAITLEQEAAGEEDAGVMSANESLESAESMYNQVLDSDASAAFRANAAAGLANVAETRNDFTAAADYWAKAKQLADEARLATIAAQATLRLTMLEDLAQPIVFGESADEATNAPDSPESPVDTDAQPSDASEAAETTEATADAAPTPVNPGQ
jgi:tetratricopeptide (TPR) repeat protein